MGLEFKLLDQLGEKKNTGRETEEALVFRTL